MGEHDNLVTRYHRFVGAELRQLRKRHNWTRSDLKQRLRNDISLKTIAAYETGIRRCTVAHFVEICFALDEAPHDVLARVDTKARTDERDTTRTNGVHIDLQAITEDDDPVLAPLRRWATARRTAGTDDSTTAFLDHAALTSLAHLCAIPIDDLTIRLRHRTTKPMGPDSGNINRGVRHRTDVTGMVAPILPNVVHPEVLLHALKFQNRAFYAGVRDALHLVLDHGKRTLDSKLQTRWKKLRIQLLGKDVPERYPSDPLGEVFSHF